MKEKRWYRKIKKTLDICREKNYNTVIVNVKSNSENVIVILNGDDTKVVGINKNW